MDQEDRSHKTVTCPSFFFPPALSPSLVPPVPNNSVAPLPLPNIITVSPNVSYISLSPTRITTPPSPIPAPTVPTRQATTSTLIGRNNAGSNAPRPITRKLASRQANPTVAFHEAVLHFLQLLLPLQTLSVNIILATCA